MLDLRTAAVTDRRGRGDLAARLALDTVDVALWTLAPHGGADVAAEPGAHPTGRAGSDGNG